VLVRHDLAGGTVRLQEAKHVLNEHPALQGVLQYFHQRSVARQEDSPLVILSFSKVGPIDVLEPDQCLAGTRNTCDQREVALLFLMSFDGDRVESRERPRNPSALGASDVWQRLVVEDDPCRVH